MNDAKPMTNGMIAQGAGAAAATAVGVLVSFLPYLEIGLRIASLLVGLAIGIVTLISMLRKMRRPKNNKHHKS